LSNLDHIHGARMRKLVEAAVAPATVGNNVRRARLMALVQPGVGDLPEIAANLGAATWSRQEQWLWYLATCHLPTGVSVGSDRVDTLRLAIDRISDEWSSFSAVEGTAYVASAPSELDPQVIDILRQRTFRFHTIEVDAFLLAEAQDMLSTSISDRLYLAQINKDAASGAIDTKRALVQFRQMYWGDRIAERGFTANRLLVARRNVKDLPARISQLKVDAEEAVSSASERANEDTSAALGVLTVVGLPISTALAVWGALGATLTGLLVAAATSVAASLVLVFAVPGLRRIGKRIIGLGRKNV